MVSYQFDSACKYGGVVSKADQGQEIRNGIRRQYKINKRADQGRLDGQRRFPIKSAIIRREEIFDKGNRYGGAAQFAPKATTKGAFIVLGLPKGGVCGRHA